MKAVSLILALLSSSPLAESDVTAESPEQEKSTTIHKIELLGGTMTTDESLASDTVVGIDFRYSRRLKDGHLHLLSQFKNLRTLNLSDTRITDSGLSDLRGLQNLRSLNLFGAKITDAGLGSVCDLKTLTNLQIGDTGITDTALSELNRLENLTTLVLWNTRITDEGLKQVAQIKSLKTLSLGGERMKVTQIGLLNLGQLSNLKTLFLADIRPSYPIVKSLKTSNPKLSIPNTESLDSPAPGMMRLFK